MENVNKNTELDNTDKKLIISNVSKRYFCNCGYNFSIDDSILLYSNDKFSPTLCPKCKDIMYCGDNVC